MTSIVYVFGDAYTGAIIEEISLDGVTITDKFGGGDLRGSTHLDQTGKDNDTILSATEPGRCYVVVERDSVPIWSGIVWTRTYQSQSKSLELYCRSYDAYTERRFILSDYSQTDIEQRNIFTDLYNTMQADANSIRISIPGAFSTVITKTVQVFGYEFKTYRQVLDSISDGDDGFDWTVRVSRAQNAYIRTLILGYPNIGTLDHSGLVFEYPGNILNYWKNESMAAAATHVFGLGAGEGASMLTATVIEQDLLSGGFPRYDVSLGHKDLEDQNRLNSITNQEAIISRAPMPMFTVELKADRDPEFGSYSIGDACTLIINDARHPNVLQKQTRISGISYTPPSGDSTEISRLTFEGDDI